MHPILFEIPGLHFPVRSFGVMLAAGFLVGSWLFARLFARYPIEKNVDASRYAQIPVWILVGVVLGARLMYVVVEVAKGSEVGHQYLDKPWTVFAVWEGGLVMYGGLIGGILFGAWPCFKARIPIPPAFDLALVAAMFGYAIGRVGCLLVGDDYGAVVPERFRDLPFPVVLHVPDPLPPQSLFGLENAGKVLWATQPWMTINGLLLGTAGLLLLKHRRFPGQVGLLIVLGYAIDRSIIEHFRGDAVRGVWFGGAISTSQLISIVSGVLALVLLAVNWNRRAPSVV